MKEEKTVVKDKKPGFFRRTSSRLARFFREMRSELKKVLWPTRKQLVNNTIVVLACVAVVGALVGLFDLVTRLAVDQLIELFRV